jgi:hypothetical protein
MCATTFAHAKKTWFAQALQGLLVAVAWKYSGLDSSLLHVSHQLSPAHLIAETAQALVDHRTQSTLLDAGWKGLLEVVLVCSVHRHHPANWYTELRTVFVEYGARGAASTQLVVAWLAGNSTWLK